jgi:PAS domain-containing protein
MSPNWGKMRELVESGFLSDTHNDNRAWRMDYIPSEDQKIVIAAIEEAVRTKTIFNVEHRVRQADGGIRWTRSRAVPVLNDAGEIVEWAGSASDGVARHEPEQQVRDLNATLQDASRRRCENRRSRKKPYAKPRRWRRLAN